MKKKSLKFVKKIIKRHLLSSSIVKVNFLVIQLKVVVDLLFFEKKNKNYLIDSFSKQVFNNLTFLNSNNLKYPNVLISIFDLKDVLEYCSTLIKKQNLSSIFLLKIYFLFFKVFKNLLTFIFNSFLKLNLILSFFLTNIFSKNLKIKHHKIIFPVFIEYKLNLI